MTMHNPGNIIAVGVAYPEQVRTNAWWEDHYPNEVANAREAMLAKIWANHAQSPGHGGESVYDLAIAGYLADPFRGTVERRWMGPHDNSMDLSLAAMEAALASAGLTAHDIDLFLIHSLRPDTYGVGDAAHLMTRLGVRKPAVNFESACASALVGYQLASDMIRVGRHRRIMVVSTCTYSRDVDPADSFSWFLGDCATAFILEPAPSPDQGLLGSHTVPTLETCTAFSYELTTFEGQPRVLLHANPMAGKIIRDTSELYLRQCVDGALSEAGVAMSDIDFLVVNTPTAWYAQFIAAALGKPMEQAIDTYPRFANVGPALWANGLYTALAEGRVRPGDLVLGYAIGSVSTASAVVMRVGEIAVGRRELVPRGPSHP